MEISVFFLRKQQVEDFSSTRAAVGTTISRVQLLNALVSLVEKYTVIITIISNLYHFLILLVTFAVF